MCMTVKITKRKNNKNVTPGTSKTSFFLGVLVHEEEEEK